MRLAFAYFSFSRGKLVLTHSVFHFPHIFWALPWYPREGTEMLINYSLFFPMEIEHEFDDDDYEVVVKYVEYKQKLSEKWKISPLL